MSCKDIPAAGLTRARDNAHIRGQWLRARSSKPGHKFGRLIVVVSFGHLTHLHNAHAKKA